MFDISDTDRLIDNPDIWSFDMLISLLEPVFQMFLCFDFDFERQYRRSMILSCSIFTFW